MIDFKEDIAKKQTFQFEHCPNYSTPLLQFGQLYRLFSSNRWRCYYKFFSKCSLPLKTFNFLQGLVGFGNLGFAEIKSCPSASPTYELPKVMSSPKWRFHAKNDFLCTFYVANYAHQNIPKVVRTFL